MHSDVPGRFAAGMKLFALPKSKDLKPEPARRELEVEDLWPHKGLLVLKFRGVDSISEAELLIGSELQVPSAERANLEAGWNYVSDLVGCTVLDHAREIGRIEDVQFGAGEAPLLIVAGSAGGARKEIRCAVRRSVPGRRGRWAAASAHESSRRHAGNQCSADGRRKAGAAVGEKEKRH